MVCLYHPGCGIYYVNLEACGGDQSPGGAASTVRLVQLGISEPRWGCNNREIVAIKVCCERSARTDK